MKIQLGREFNLKVKKEIIKKKFPRITDEELNKMNKELEEKEGQTEGNTIRSRIPNFFGNNGGSNNNNANQGGINRG